MIGAGRFAVRGQTRMIFGLGVSVVFIAVTASRVDLAAVAAALARVDPVGLALALVLVGVEVGLRTLRWQLLLRPIRPVPYQDCVAYSCIGYFANSLLPARLGDVARAYLAGGAFGIERIAVLGTILVERVADGTFILLLVASVGVVVVGGGSFATAAIGLGAAAIIGALGLAVVAVLIRRTGFRRSRLGTIAADWWARLAAGTVALRSPRDASAIGGLTVVAFAVAVASFAIVARSLGLVLSPAQATLAMGAVALSMSIPAAPGSLGTYEFVGVAVLTSLGIAPELAFATILLVHLIATLPPALAGLFAAWHLHFRVGAIDEALGAAPRMGDPLSAKPT